MPIQMFAVSGYRSLFQVHLRLERVNVLVGPNGSGKTNLYRSMYLLERAAQGQLARALAEEGGMPSALWAGDRHKGPVRMTLEVRLDDVSYEISCGLPQRTDSAFVLDPEVKEEHIWLHKGKQKIHLLKRDRSFVRARDAEGNWVEFAMEFADSESVLSELREPARFPALARVRQEFLHWRFYHQFRTDPGSPLRRTQAAVRTPVLSHDGSDLAAALQTIVEIGDRARLEQAIDAAFPGGRLHISSAGGSVGLFLPGIPRRPLSATELSDGTLQYLCLLAVLLSPRPPALLALNEPETSIHPSLQEPLARLIVEASQSSQLWITTHSEVFANYLKQQSGAMPIQVRMNQGRTVVEQTGEEDE